MKTLLIAAILLCLAGVMACEDIAIGECPISVVGDTAYVFPLECDRVYIRDHGYTPDIEVTRNYVDDGYKVEFYEDLGRSTNKIIVTLPSNNVYVLPVIHERDNDNFSYQFSFEWRGKDY